MSTASLRPVLWEEVLLLDAFLAQSLDLGPGSIEIVKFTPEGNEQSLWREELVDVRSARARIDSVVAIALASHGSGRFRLRHWVGRKMRRSHTSCAVLAHGASADAPETGKSPCPTCANALLTVARVEEELQREFGIEDELRAELASTRSALAASEAVVVEKTAESARHARRRAKLADALRRAGIELPK